MQLYGIIYVVSLFILTFLLAVGGYFIQRDRYWRRIWEELGKPNVNSIKELKAYIHKQPSPILSMKIKNGYLNPGNK
jgi:hypothetical protein